MDVSSIAPEVNSKEHLLLEDLHFSRLLIMIVIMIMIVTTLDLISCPIEHMSSELGIRIVSILARPSI